METMFDILNNISNVIWVLFAVFIVLSLIYSVCKKPELCKNSEIDAVSTVHNDFSEYNKFLNENNFQYSDDVQASCSKKLELCNAFLERNPDNKHAIMEKAFLYYKLGKYNEAISIYETELDKIDNDNIFKDTYITCYACCLAESGNKNAAFDMLERFYKDKSAKYYLSIASVYEALKEYGKAIDNCSTAIKYNPDDESAFRKRAKIYKILNKNYDYNEDIKKADEIREKRMMPFK